MALRELIKDAHDSAENHPFVKKLFAGQITKEEYGDFLFNQKHCYATLEQRAEDLGLLDREESYDDIPQTEKITQVAEKIVEKIIYKEISKRRSLPNRRMGYTPEESAVAG